MKKILLNLLLGASLSLGTGLTKNVNAQNPDSLYIKIDTLNIGQPNQRIWAKGYYNKEWVSYVGCSGYKENHYNERQIHLGIRAGNPIHFIEEFKIDYKTNLIDYTISDMQINFKNLTKEQISQDKKFAERTKKIINACESKTKLREMVKEISKEEGPPRIPNIKQ